MKFRIFAVLIFAGFLSSGCRENYLAEKEFWRAQRQLKNSPVYTQPSNATPQDFERVIQAYEKVVELYPGSPKAVDSLFTIANLQLMMRKLPETRQTYTRIIQNYSAFPDAAAKARASMAILFEKEKNWKSAQSLYWEIAEYHSLQALGLSAPLKALALERQYGKVEDYKRAFAKTVDHYEGLLKKAGPIQAAASIQYHHALAYLIHEDWNKATELWFGISKEYPKSNLAGWAYLAAVETIRQKQGEEQALPLYEEFLKLFPNHSLTKQASLGVAKVFEIRKDYAQSRQWMEKVLKEQKLSLDETAQIKFQRASLFQKEGLWEAAEQSYKEIEDKFPNSREVLQIPLMRALHYQSQGNTAKSEAMLKEAVASYEQVKESIGSPIAKWEVEKFANVAYAGLGDWEKIISNLDHYSQMAWSEQDKGSWVFLKAWLTESRIKNNTEAAQLYQSFLITFPDHPLNHFAKTRLQSLHQSA